MSDKIEVSAGDYGFDINLTVNKSDGTAYNLTGKSVDIKVWRKGRTSNPLIDSSCDIDDAANGLCHYTAANGAITTPGAYSYELEIIASGLVESTKAGVFEVFESP